MAAVRMKPSSPFGWASASSPSRSTTSAAADDRPHRDRPMRRLQAERSGEAVRFASVAAVQTAAEPSVGVPLNDARRQGSPLLARLLTSRH
jgi:hypothetical protein